MFMITLIRPGDVVLTALYDCSAVRKTALVRQQNQESNEEKLRSEQHHRFLTQEASTAKREQQEII